MNIQWYPGHMTKTKRMIAENIKLVDCVLELVDARIPLSSQNPQMDEMVGAKPRIMLLNKADMADEAANGLWVDYFSQKGIGAVLMNSITGKGIQKIGPAVKAALSDKLERDRARGIVNRAIKLMVVGVPNVGKSSFINKFAGRSSAKTGDKPGVTRAKQWIRLASGFELLDTPGILWPKFDDAEVAKKLAFTGAIKDEILDVEELCHYLLEFLSRAYPERLQERYKISDFEGLKGYEITEKIGRAQGLCHFRRGSGHPAGVKRYFRRIPRREAWKNNLGNPC